MYRKQEKPARGMKQLKITVGVRASTVVINMQMKEPKGAGDQHHARDICCQKDHQK